MADATGVKKSHKKLWIGLGAAIVLLIIIISASSGSGSKTSATTATTAAAGSVASAKAAPTTSASNAMPKIGQTANDGKFQFTVKSVKCGVSQVGSSGLTQDAQGQYCLLDVGVKNIGNASQSFDATSQYLYNASGQKYSASSLATIYEAASGSSWYQDINPGNSTEGTVVFDIPKGQTPVTAELHDSMFSSGVKVSLQ